MQSPTHTAGTTTADHNTSTPAATEASAPQLLTPAVATDLTSAAAGHLTTRKVGNVQLCHLILYFTLRGGRMINVSGIKADLI